MGKIHNAFMELQTYAIPLWKSYTRLQKYVNVNKCFYSKGINKQCYTQSVQRNSVYNGIPAEFYGMFPFRRNEITEFRKIHWNSVEYGIL